jgi:tetratricopeptide (TPR) repeat protein
MRENDEISNIISALGLEFGKKYQSTRQLRYGKIVIMADADCIDENTFIDSRENFYDLALSYFPNLKRFTNEYWQRQMFGLGRIYQKRGDYKKARVYYKKSLEYLINKKGILGYILSFFPILLQKKISSLRF